MDELPIGELSNALHALMKLSDELDPSHPGYVEYMGIPCVRQRELISTIAASLDEPWLVHKVRHHLVDMGYLSEPRKTTETIDSKVKFIRVTHLRSKVIRLALDAT